MFYATIRIIEKAPIEYFCYKPILLIVSVKIPPYDH